MLGRITLRGRGVPFFVFLGHDQENPMNKLLKLAIIEKFDTQHKAAAAFGIRPDRLSRIVTLRVKPSAEEKRVIAWRLQKPISELFGDS
jgi:hypothetical protein